MKWTKLIAALIAMLMLLVLPMYAAAETADVSAADTAQAVEEPAADNRMLFGVMLLSTVFAAMVVSTLIFKGRDHTKYL